MFLLKDPQIFPFPLFFSSKTRQSCGISGTPKDGGGGNSSENQRPSKGAPVHLRGGRGESGSWLRQTKLGTIPEVKPSHLLQISGVFLREKHRKIREVQIVLKG